MSFQPLSPVFPTHVGINRMPLMAFSIRCGLIEATTSNKFSGFRTCALKRAFV